jgi:hypothetical protein
MSKPITRRRSLILPAAAAALIAAPAIIKSADAQFFNPALFIPEPAGSGFNPTSLITGAGGFWRADTGVGVSGSNVTGWTDQSSFAQNLSPSSTAPTWSATGFLSAHPAVTFNGASSTYLLKNSFAFSHSTCSNFIMFYWPSTPSNYDGVCSLINSADPNDYNGSSSYAHTAQGGSTIVDIAHNSIQIVTSSAIGTNTAVLAGFVLDGVNFTQWINGSTASPAGAAQASTDLIGGTTNYFVIGARIVGGTAPSAVFGSPVVAFCGITQKVMNSTDWTNLKNWSNSNWGTSF